MGANNRYVQKDLDKGVRLGDTSYPGELESTTGLILQYEKEKERELLRRKKYNNRYNNDNNNNNNEYDNDKTETIAVIVKEKEDSGKKTMEKVFAMVEAGSEDNPIGGMNEDEFKAMLDEEEYYKECDALLCDDHDELLG